MLVTDCFYGRLIQNSSSAFILLFTWCFILLFRLYKEIVIGVNIIMLGDMSKQ